MFFLPILGAALGAVGSVGGAALGTAGALGGAALGAAGSVGGAALGTAGALGGAALGAAGSVGGAALGTAGSLGSAAVAAATKGSMLQMAGVAGTAAYLLNRQAKAAEQQRQELLAAMRRQQQEIAYLQAQMRNLRANSQARAELYRQEEEAWSRYDALNAEFRDLTASAERLRRQRVTG